MTKTMKEFASHFASVGGKARWAGKSKEERSAHMKKIRASSSAKNKKVV